MSLQTVIGNFAIPANPRISGGSPAFATALTLNEADDTVEYVFVVPKTGNITHLGINIGSVTTAQNLKVALENVGADGNADGTNYGGSAPKTDLDPTSLANTWVWVPLVTAAGATFGDPVAATVKFNATAGSVGLRTHTTSTAITIGTRYVGLYDQTGAAWTKTGAMPVFGVKYDDGNVYHCDSLPISAFTSYTFNSTTGTYDEYALKFRLPFPCRIKGAIANLLFVLGAEFVLKLFEGTTERAATPTMKQKFTSTGSSQVVSVLGLFSTPYAIAKDTDYYLSVIPTIATNVTLPTTEVDTAATMDGLEGGQNFSMGKRLNGGAWTDVATSRPMIWLLCDQFDDGAGGGSGGNMNLIKPAVL